MLQFAMNSPGNGNCRMDFGGGIGPGGRRINRLLTLGCFTAIAALHIAAIAAFGLFAKPGRPFTETRELSLTLDFADPGLEELTKEAELQAAPEMPLPAAALPREEAPLPEAVLEENPVPEAETVSGAASLAEPETAVPVAASFSTPAEGPFADTGNNPLPAPVRSAPAQKKPMTDAEYLALIMGRLERNKIYPLSVRRRGIEGNITVDFTIRPDGTVSDMSLADPSGHRFLAQAAFETIRSAAPFPVLEGHEGDYTVRVSIRYQLED